MWVKRACVTLYPITVISHLVIEANKRFYFHSTLFYFLVPLYHFWHFSIERSTSPCWKLSRLMKWKKHLDTGHIFLLLFHHHMLAWLSVSINRNLCTHDRSLMLPWQSPSSLRTGGGHNWWSAHCLPLYKPVVSYLSRQCVLLNSDIVSQISDSWCYHCICATLSFNAGV